MNFLLNFFYYVNMLKFIFDEIESEKKMALNKK